MLYVFQVENGQMTTYDVTYSMKTVADLKEAIERKTKIPVASIVLLVSGGNALKLDDIVSIYGGGTQSNPIFQFSKPTAKDSFMRQQSGSDEEVSQSDILNSYDEKSKAELRASIEKCYSMLPTVNTVVRCANLAQHFKDLALELGNSCESLVHEQHLQHMGWMAVIANLDDVFKEFCQRSVTFKESFRAHRQKKEGYREHLDSLNNVLEALGKIPMLPALKLNAEEHRFSAFDVYEETEFEGNYYRISQPSEDNSETNFPQDFGVQALKLPDEDVFEQKDASTSKDVASLQSQSDVVQQIEQLDEEIQFRAHSYEGKDNPTLLHWILAQGNKTALKDIVDYCQKGLALIDADLLKEQEMELLNLFESANSQGLKQIKGIEDRLYRLDQFLSQVKKLERDQFDQASSMTQYRDRMNTLCDPSVLPTLVQSHCCQLEKLLKGHYELVDIRLRIAKSKDELSHILRKRLETILVIENSMSVQDAHAMLSFQCYARLERYFGIVGQLHAAPRTFLRAVHEVVRRKRFSTAYRAWAQDLSEKLLKIYTSEVSLRREFNACFEGHFLKSLYPGMADMPPAFATEAPPAFDDRLPDLTEEDVHNISEAFPEFAGDVPKIDMEPVVKFFQQRLNADGAEADKEFESELETGDFEKLPGGQPEKICIDTSTTCAPESTAVATLTEVGTPPAAAGALSPPRRADEFENSEFYIEESLPSSLDWGRQDRQDNMDTHKIIVEKLKEFLHLLLGLCRTNIVFMREEMCKVKMAMREQKEFFTSTYLEILEALKKSNEENELKFQQQTQRLTVDHELELSDMKAALSNKDDVIDSLKKATEDLAVEHQKHIEEMEKQHDVTKEMLKKAQDDIKAMEVKLVQFNEQKEKDIKDVQDNLHLTYKAEIESLRSRFRLVALTSTDRSPSESSLEKIERTDVIEISSHNAIVMQTKENAEVEREEAVRAALERCEADWSRRLQEEISTLRNKYEADKQVSINEVTRRLLSEKDRQLEAARDREQGLARECAKYRDTIQQLTDPETNELDNLLKCQLATLENEKAALQQQIVSLKKDLEKKEEAQRSRDDDSEDRSPPPSAGPSPLAAREERERRRVRARSHTPYGLGVGTLSLSACLPGHVVLVLWDPSHHNYTVLQEAQIMFFVHSECLPALGLSITVRSESERRLYTIGIVESKDYCYAKKIGNRYHMPYGSRFYRVRLRPARPSPPPPCCDLRHRTDTLQSRLRSTLGANQPIRKWLTYMHAPDMQRSVDTSQSISLAAEEPGRQADDTGRLADEAGGPADETGRLDEAAGGQAYESARPAEVATGTLINLESPASVSEPASAASADQPDSIDTSDLWHAARTYPPAVTDMECSVGQCADGGSEPLELTVSALEVVARGAAPPGSELAQEAEP